MLKRFSSALKGITALSFNYIAEEETEITKQEQKTVIKALLQERKLFEDRYQKQKAELAQLTNYHKTLQDNVQTV